MAKVDYKQFEGRVVGQNWKLVEFLGEGGMGAVFEAHHLVIGVKRAVKFLKSNESKERFLREVRLHAKIVHPNVVRVIDYVTDEVHGPFILMDLVVGTDLGTRRRFDPLEGLRISEQLAAALEAAHELGIVHRDIKPTNVLLNRQSDAFLADWGLAKRIVDDETTGGDVTADSAEVTKTETPAGFTPRYASPEQYWGEGEPLDRRWDIFSLGAVLYEVFTGQLFLHEYKKKLEVLKVRYSPPWRHVPLYFDQLDPPLDDKIVRIIRKCVALEATGRYANASELLADLRECRKRMVAEAGEKSVVSPADSDETVPDTFDQRRSGLHGTIESQVAKLREFHQLLERHGIDRFAADVRDIERERQRIRQRENAEAFAEALRGLEDLADQCASAVAVADETVRSLLQEARADLDSRWGLVLQADAEIAKQAEPRRTSLREAIDADCAREAWPSAFDQVEALDQWVRDCEGAVRRDAEQAVESSLQEFESLRTHVGDAVPAMDVVDVPALRAEALGHLDAGRFKEARAVVFDAANGLRSAARDRAADLAARVRGELRELSRAKATESFATDIESAEVALREGEGRLAANDLLAAYDRLQDAHGVVSTVRDRAAELARRSESERDARSRLAELRAVVTTLAGLGDEDLPRLEGSLDRIEALLTDGAFEEARQLAESTLASVGGRAAVLRSALEQQMDAQRREIESRLQAVDLEAAASEAPTRRSAFLDARDRAAKAAAAGDLRAAVEGYDNALAELETLESSLRDAFAERRQGLLIDTEQLREAIRSRAFAERLEDAVNPLAPAAEGLSDWSELAIFENRLAQLRAELEDLDRRIAARSELQRAADSIAGGPADLYGPVLDEANGLLALSEPPPAERSQATLAAINAVLEQAPTFETAVAARERAQQRLKDVKSALRDTKTWRVKRQRRRVEYLLENAAAAFVNRSWTESDRLYNGATNEIAALKRLIDSRPVPWPQVALAVVGVPALIFIGANTIGADVREFVERWIRTPVPQVTPTPPGGGSVPPTSSTTPTAEPTATSSLAPTATPTPTPTPEPELEAEFAFEPDPSAERLSLPYGRRQTFRLVPSGDTDAAQFSWRLGGKVVSEAESYSFPNDVPSLAGESDVDLRAVATGAGGQRYERRWRLSIPRPPAVRLERGSPAAAEVTAMVGEPVVVSVRSGKLAPGQSPRFVFAVGDDVAAEGPETSFTFTPRESGEFRIVARSVDAFGQKSANEVSWTVAVVSPIKALLEAWARDFVAAKTTGDVETECRLRQLDRDSCEKLITARAMQKNYEASFPTGDPETLVTGPATGRVSFRMRERFTGPDFVPVNLDMQCDYEFELRDGKLVVISNNPCRRVS